MDAWNWSGPYVLRWRSRLPVGPAVRPLRARLRDRLQALGHPREAGRRLLSRSTTTSRFRTASGRSTPSASRLALDPVWKPQVRVPETFRPGALPAHQGFVVKVPLTYTGTGTPRDRARHREPAPARGAACSSSAWRSWSSTFGGARARRALGRFAPLTPPECDRRGVAVEEPLLALARGGRRALGREDRAARGLRGHRAPRVREEARDRGRRQEDDDAAARAARAASPATTTTSSRRSSSERPRPTPTRSRRTTSRAASIPPRRSRPA